MLCSFHPLSTSGGRVSIYVDDTTRFKGTYAASGGMGFQQGSAGTVFVERRMMMDRMGGVLRISNEQLGGDGDSHEQSPAAMHTTVSDASPYGPLDELHITGHARVVYKSAAKPLQVRRLIGDGSGTLLISAGTALIPATADGGGQLDAGGGVLQLSNLTMVIAGGGVIQASDIRIGNGGQLVLTSAGGTSLSEKSDYNFRNIAVDEGGVIKIDYHLMNQSPSPLFETVSLSALDSFIVNAGGRVHSDSQGFFGSVGLPVSCSASINGRGCGQSGTAGGGGGAYGGFGGPGLSAVGGSHYGDAVQPLEPGSGGGGCFRQVLGGDGGGVLFITASNMKIDGSLSANGGPGDGAGAGGGSGMPLLYILYRDDVALIRSLPSNMVLYRWVYSACR